MPPCGSCGQKYRGLSRNRFARRGSISKVVPENQVVTQDKEAATLENQNIEVETEELLVNRDSEEPKNE